MTNKLKGMSLQELIQYAKNLKEEGAGVSELLECFNEMLNRLEDCDKPDDYEYISKKEENEINQSLDDYATGKYKHGSIQELLKDLKDND